MLPWVAQLLPRTAPRKEPSPELGLSSLQKQYVNDVSDLLHSEITPLRVTSLRPAGPSAPPPAPPPPLPKGLPAPSECGEVLRVAAFRPPQGSCLGRQQKAMLLHLDLVEGEWRGSGQD